MANFVELSGGTIIPSSALAGGVLDQNAALDGGAIQIAGGGGGGGNLTTKTVSYTPTESAQSDTQNPPTGYDGFSQFTVNVGAISSTYVGTGITRRTSSDLSASGATVTAPSGYYENSASKTIGNASFSVGAFSIDNNGDAIMDVSVDTAGYVSNNFQLTEESVVSPLGATTYYPSTSDQTIASGKYLMGAQTIKGVTITNLSAANIVNGVTVEVGDVDDPDRVASVTGTASGGFDFWNKAQPTGAQSTTRTSVSAYVAYGRTGITSLSAPNATSINDYSLYGCTGLTSVSLPVCTSTGAQSMRGCTNLLSVSLPELQIIGGATGSTSKTHLFYGCTKLVDVWMPKVYYFQGYEFSGCTALTGLDFPKLKTIKANAFSSCSNLNVLILRRNEVASVSNINSFSGTPFASGGSGGTLYVPESLISSYQSASVWSTLLGYANNSIKKIEGSAYEHYYYNGDPIT